MGKHRGVVFAAIVGIACARMASAQPAAPGVSDLEFKCMAKTSKAGAKFWLAKTKCVTRCFDKFWDGLVPETDCMPPYGGFTAACIDDTLLNVKGAENKLTLAIRKACDPTFKPGLDCPECYDGGNCSDSGEALDRMADLENQLDSFVPGMFCERTGAFILEQRCQTTVARRIAKYVGGAAKCYDKCVSNARKGYFPFAACQPPASDPTTQACLASAAGAGTYYIDHDCDPPPASPDACGSPYPTGADWMYLIGIAVNGNVPGTYCASPGGAFLD